MYTVDAYDYDLPDALIAQHPLKERANSRLLVVDCASQQLAHQKFTDVIDWLRPNDLLVLNNTKVFPARLYGQKASGGSIECLIERLLADNQVLAHIRASKAPKPESEIIFHNDTRATVVGRQQDLFLLQFPQRLALLAWLERVGNMPLPPYISRQPEKSDSERYQTVYAEHVGAVAAPTAGLHFDQTLLQSIQAKGVALGYVTLHVGAGTFQPVRVQSLTDHVMHAEWLEVSETVCQQIRHCRQRGGRVVAVGTTVVRSLETAAAGGDIKPYSGDTDIFIYPGFQFHCVDALITNFHLPKSTLMMLVSALAGYDLIRQAYQQAIAERYRFFSYGDAMLIISNSPPSSESRH